MSMVWPCPLTVGAYASMGRAVRVPRPGCPSWLGGVVVRPLSDALRAAVAAIGAAFTGAAGVPGWAVLGRWRFACAVTGGSLLAASASSRFLIIGRRRFMPPRGS